VIEYVVSGNIDDRVMAKSASLLAKGGLVALPTDTSWSIVCSFKSREGIKRLESISRQRDEYHFTLLCSALSQVNELCCLDNGRFRLIKRLTPGPYVFVLKTLLGTEKILGLRRREIGIRIPKHPLPPLLIKALGSPLYAITAKRTMLPLFDGDGEELFDGGWELDAIHGLDLIIDTGDEQARLFSTVLDLSGDEVRLIRAGAGAWPV
jgi:tRNA threonylcarbamoyl adenosine modification protein (Sua5/YciO/YrdC/YwlC family)